MVDSHERYPYTFTGQQVRTMRRGLTCGDYAVTMGRQVVAAVERKSLADLVSSLTSGRLRYALAELATLPRAAVVVEDRYSQVFTLDRVRPAQVADGLAELQVRWPSILIVYGETRKLAEEWTYRYLAAAHAWAEAEPLALGRIGVDVMAAAPTELLDLKAAAPDTAGGHGAPTPSTKEVRAWAVANGFAVSDRGRLRPEVYHAWQEARMPGQPG